MCAVGCPLAFGGWPVTDCWLLAAWRGVVWCGVVWRGAAAVYVRGVDCEDMSHFIKEVRIELHSSFQEPVRGTRHPCRSSPLPV